MSLSAPVVAGIPLTESILNWLWLADLPAWDRALEVTGGPVPLGPAVEAHFGLRESVDIGAWLASPGERLYHPEPQYDCIIAHGVFEVPPGGRRWRRADRHRFLAEARKGLKQGGCLALSFTNPLRALLRPTPRAPGQTGPAWRAPGLSQVWRIRAELRQAGFCHLRTYYLEPSLMRVRYLTPNSRPLIADRIARRPRSDHRRVARWLAAAGLGDLNFPATLLLAYA